MRRHAIEQGKLEIVEIRVEYLSKYLQARQMALLVEHIRRLQLYNPTQDVLAVKRRHVSGGHLADALLDRTRLKDRKLQTLVLI